MPSELIEGYGTPVWERGWLPTIFYDPLELLYLNGPPLSGHGFWQGQGFVDICASSTGMRSKFWEGNLTECYTLVGRKVTGFVVLTHTLIAFYLLTVILAGCYTRCVCTQPIMNELRAIRKTFLPRVKKGVQQMRKKIK